MQVNCNELGNENKGAPGCPWGLKIALTAEEIEMVGEPLYDCFMPTADTHPSVIDNTVSTLPITLRS